MEETTSIPIGLHPYFISFPLDFIKAKTGRNISKEQVKQINFEITYIEIYLNSGETIKIKWKYELEQILK